MNALARLRICSVEDVPEDEPLGLDLENGMKIAVYNVEGEFFVLDDICTHGDARLSEGWQEGKRIECPFHGGAFWIKSGEPAAYPCVRALKSYPVTLEDGEIVIALDQADAPT